MFAIKPILWYDVNRVAPRDVKRLHDEYGKSGFMLPVIGENAVGVVKAHYPTPDQLFRWTSKEK